MKTLALLTSLWAAENFEVKKEVILSLVSGQEKIAHVWLDEVWAKYPDLTADAITEHLNVYPLDFESYIYSVDPKQLFSHGLNITDQFINYLDQKGSK